MSDTALLDAPQAAVATPPERKVHTAHPWVGKAVLYWRITQQTTGAISPLPAMLIQPGPRQDGSWDLNVHRVGAIQGRNGVRFSETPRAGCWTWPQEEAPAKAEKETPTGKGRSKDLSKDLSKGQ